MENLAQRSDNAAFACAPAGGFRFQAGASLPGRRYNQDTPATR
jgi:hypothetical protein